MVVVAAAVVVVVVVWDRNSNTWYDRVFVECLDVSRRRRLHPPPHNNSACHDFGESHPNQNGSGHSPYPHRPVGYQ